MALSRSEIMRRVPRKHTTPELAVRRQLFSMGKRYRLHATHLPGSPDIVLSGIRLAIFVHGCFWHRHQNCRKCTSPKTREEFWRDKFQANIERDRRNIEALHALGWRTAVIWECETRDTTNLSARLERLVRPTQRA